MKGWIFYTVCMTIEGAVIGILWARLRIAKQIIRENHEHLLNRMVAVTLAVIDEHEKKKNRQAVKRCEEFQVNVREVVPNGDAPVSAQNRRE